MKKINVVDKIFDAISYLFLSLIGLITVIPFLYVIGTSVATNKEVLSKGYVLFPKEGFDFSTYRFVFESGFGIPRGYMVTIFVTLVGTSLGLLITAMLAYGLSKSSYPGKRVISIMVVMTMLFNGGIIPTYLVVKSLGLINSVWAMILPTMCSVWNTMVLISFFRGIPSTIEEAAKIDGCGYIQIFSKIILPLSKPALASIALFYGVFNWNQWFTAVFYITDKTKWPLQLILRQIIYQENTQVETAMEILPPNLSIKAAAVIIVSLPIMMLYPFLQKYFVKGVMIGSVKG